jgi:hypothetical protein
MSFAHYNESSNRQIETLVICKRIICKKVKHIDRTGALLLVAFSNVTSL